METARKIYHSGLVLFLAGAILLFVSQHLSVEGTLILPFAVTGCVLVGVAVVVFGCISFAGYFNYRMQASEREKKFCTLMTHQERRN